LPDRHICYRGLFHVRGASEQMSFGPGYIAWKYRKYRKRSVRLICSRLYRDDNRNLERSMLIAGAGRSGTTWLADIIASQVSCRLMFEPFNSHQVPSFSQFHYFHYARPAQQDDRLKGFCRQILSGDIRDPWIDRQVDRLRPECRLIKEIRANLFLKWITTQFPEVPLLFIIRHPCAVVLSRMQLGWWTDADIEPFLAQQELRRDFLDPMMGLIHDADTPEEKHAIVWCVNNLVPLRQFAATELNVVFYENLVMQPEVEIPRIFAALGRAFDDSVFAQLARPSTTTVRSSAIVSGEDRVTSWQRKLSPTQTGNVLAIVEGFGLGSLYGESAYPAGALTQ
jgi:hypothetical protein